MTQDNSTAQLVERTARELDAVEREIVCRTHSQVYWQAFMIAPEGVNSSVVAGAMRRHSDLFESKMGGAQCKVYRLSPLGLEVRTLLEKSQFAGGPRI